MSTQVTRPVPRVFPPTPTKPIPKPVAAAKPKAPPPLKRKMVVIEEGTLKSMALNPDIVREFPILAPLIKIAKEEAKGGCATCGPAAQARANTYQGVKLALAGMDSDRKRKLKDLMNASSMRLLYKDNRGKAQQLTF